MNKIIIACDPYDKLNIIQRLFKKTGLFYRNRPRCTTGIFKWKKDGRVEFIEYQSERRR